MLVSFQKPETTLILNAFRVLTLPPSLVTLQAANILDQESVQRRNPYTSSRANTRRMAWVETRSWVCNATGSTSNHGFSRLPDHSSRGSCLRSTAPCFSCGGIHDLITRRI